MLTKKLISSTLLAAILLVGCGEVKPGLSEALKGSYKITNGMSMAQVEKLMKIEPTGQEKIGDRVIWKYEGNIKKGDGENLKITYNNIIVKFNKGIVTHSGTFSCNLPKVQED
ncbi:MAG: hypothetical protein WBG69_05945 [Arcobacteraceae bacterium]